MGFFVLFYRKHVYIIIFKILKNNTYLNDYY